MRFRGTVATGLLVALACLAAACASTSSTTQSGDGGSRTDGSQVASEGTPVPGGKLTFGVDADAGGFDPAASNFVLSSYLVASPVIEPLTRFDKDRVAQPYLAESFTPTDLASLWTIKLKPNITFHDGTPLNAAAVKANIDASRNGIPAITMKLIQDVRVKDSLTVEVAMTQPWASFPAAMASQQGYMVSPASIAAHTAAEKPVGTGPFVFDSWAHGTSVSLKKNPSYWQAGKPYLDALEFKVLTDPGARSSSLSSGDVDMIVTNNTETMASLQAKPGYRTVVDKAGDTQAVVLNEARPPFDNRTARKAMVLATDTAALAEATGNGQLIPADQPFPERSQYHTSDPHYPRYDLDEAKKAVAQYTAETGQPLEFTYTTLSNVDDLQIAQQLQDMWTKAGMTVKIDSIDQTKFASGIVLGEQQAGPSPNFGFPDPDWNFIFWHSSFIAPLGTLSINFPHVSLPELDQVLVEGRASLIPEQRTRAYQKATQLLNDNYTYVWLYRTAYALIAQDRVKGLQEVSDAGFARTDAKSWWADIWLQRT